MASKKHQKTTLIIQEEESDSSDSSEEQSPASGAAVPALPLTSSEAAQTGAARSSRGDPTRSRSKKTLGSESSRSSSAGGQKSSRSKKTLTLTGSEAASPGTPRSSRHKRDKSTSSSASAEKSGLTTEKSGLTTEKSERDDASDKTSGKKSAASTSSDKTASGDKTASSDKTASGDKTASRSGQQDDKLPDMESLRGIEQKLIERARRLQQAKELIIQTKNQFNAHVFSVEKQLDHRERMLVVSQQELAQERRRLQEWQTSLEAREQELSRREKTGGQEQPALFTASSSSSLQTSSAATSAMSSSSSSSLSMTNAAEPRRQATVELEPSQARSSYAGQDGWPGVVGDGGEAAVVMDLGTYEIRAGLTTKLGGDAAPTHLLRNRTAGIVERLDEDALLLTYLHGVEGSKSYFDKKQQARRKALDVLYPLHDALLVNADHCETVLGHLYRQLDARPRDQPLLVTVSDFAGAAELQTSTEFFFETLGVRDLGYVAQSVAALASVGLHTGLSADIGYASSRIVAVYGGSPIAKQKIPLGWQQLTDAVQAALVKHHVTAETLSMRFVDELTRAALYVAPSFEAELKDCQAGLLHNYLVDLRLQNVSPVELSLERFRVAEALFRPSNLGVQSSGLQHSIRAVAASLWNDRPASRADLGKVGANVLLSGGGSQIAGLWARLRNELQQPAPSSSSSAAAASSSASTPPPLNLLAPVEASHLNVWHGAVRIARSGGGKNRITKDQYDEFGPAFLDRAFW